MTCANNHCSYNILAELYTIKFREICGSFQYCVLNFVQWKIVAYNRLTWLFYVAMINKNATEFEYL